MPRAVIVDAVRTPIGRAFKGSLAQLRPDEMGAFVVDALLDRNPEVDPALVEDVVCGVGLPQGLQGFNMGRIIALLSERLPLGTNGVTVSRYCASSLESIRQAANAVEAGQGEAYIAAGVEWVSRYNESVEGARPQDQNEHLQGKNGDPDAYISQRCRQACRLRLLFDRSIESFAVARPRRRSAKANRPESMRLDRK